VKFKSAVDWRYYIVIVFVACSLLFSLLPQVQSGEVSVFYGGSIALLALGLPVWLLFSTYYNVEGDRLTIRSGPFAWYISVSEIESTKPSQV
jgi:hypothetical protein